MKNKYDLLVIGGGSGGIAMARRAAEYGTRVALVEIGKLGGTCVNVGCVPKKVMWNASRIRETLNHANEYGFDIYQKEFDWYTLKERRDTYVKRLNSIYHKNLVSSGVDVIKGWASFSDNAHQVFVGPDLIEANHILIATGGIPKIPKIEGSHFGISSDGFFDLQQQPTNVLIVGSGYIATEFAGVLNSLGSKVTMLIRKQTLLSNFDLLLQQSIMELMSKNGIDIVPETNVKKVRRDSTDKIYVESNQKKHGPFDKLIWAIGRDPNVQDLNLKTAGIKTDFNDHVIVDKYQNTNVEGIYAVGDVTGKNNLTPVAIAAGRKLADRIFGNQTNAKLSYENIPSVIFSHPPIGTVGITEQEAVSQFGCDEVKIYESRFTNIFYGPLQQKLPTFIKLITVGSEQKILGCHVIGDSADELIQGFAVAVTMGACKSDFDNTVAIHPTAAEELVTLRGGRKSQLTP